MINNPNQPKEYDAVLGGQAPPVSDVVLGGIEGVKRRLASEFIEDREEAISVALQYGEAGLDLVVQALQDESGRVRRCAYRLLQERKEPQVQEALQQYRSWSLIERLSLPLSSGSRLFIAHVTQFANRKVEEFDLQTGITDPVGTAYALRVQKWGYERITDKLEALSQDPQVSKLEALVFGLWISDVFESSQSIEIVNFLVKAKDKLTSLKAVFIGDIRDDECMISTIGQSDISPVLEAYPNLEVLQIRGGRGLAFSPLRHEHLTALIVETSGLSLETLVQIYSLELPALEHLELWLGNPGYGRNSSVEDLIPLLHGDLFPNLVYLGLRNSEYGDEIANEIVNAPILEKIKVLDLSLGTLGNEGAEALLESPAVNRLDILNISGTYVTSEMLLWLWQQDVHVIADNSRECEYDDAGRRYCAVAE